MKKINKEGNETKKMIERVFLRWAPRGVEKSTRRVPEGLDQDPEEAQRKKKCRRKKKNEPQIGPTPKK
jgi:hypothetical protein